MNLLRIEQTYAQIGIETQRSQIQIQSKLPKLQIQQTNAKIEIDKQEPRVIIDQHACFATAGLKNVFELTDQAAQEGMQQAFEYAGKKAAEGDMLADIRNKGNAIAQIAKSNVYEEHEFNIDSIPKERPRIEVEGYINISAVKGEINSQLEEGSVSINASEPKVNLYLREKQSISIQYIGSNFDASA
jgi:hypothetical protein